MNKAVGEFFVGLTVLVGLLGVAVLLLRFGEITGSRVKHYAAYLQISDASGLSTASRVTLNGVEIGSIRAIRSEADPRGGVIVELSIVEGTRVPRDVAVTLERGLIGEATLSMRAMPLKEGAADPGFVAPGETLAVNATGMMDQIAGLLDEKLSSFKAAADEIRKLAENFGTTTDRLNDALEPRTPEQVKAGAPANLMSTIARFDEAVSSAQAWLGDESMRDDAKDAVARFRSLLDEASAAVASITKHSDALGEQGATALAEFATAARSLSETAHEVQALTAKINQGEGTAGMLVNNPDLYRSLNDAAIRLERALSEAQLLFETYRKDGLPLKF